jgi:BMFP domain-containing protein YqiC
MQTDNRVFDSVARAFTNAAGAAQAFRTEIETMIKGKLEKLVADMDLVPRADFDVVKAMAAKARAENEKLSARLAELEAKLGSAAKDTASTPLKAARVKPVRPVKTPRPKRPAAKL